MTKNPTNFLANGSSKDVLTLWHQDISIPIQWCQSVSVANCLNASARKAYQVLKDQKKTT